MKALALWLYRIATMVALPLAAPFLLLADRRRGHSRPSIASRMGRSLPPIPRQGVWVQAVSVGEVAVARPLMIELRRRLPELPIVLSATTSTGLALASGQNAADVIVPYPLDLTGAVRRFLAAVAPRLVVLVETELWPEMLAQCAALGVPVALVNARVSDRSFRGYNAVRTILRPLLQPLTVVAAQHERDAERLAAMGVPRERIHITGNVKFDIPEPQDKPELAALVRALAGDRQIWIAGSTMPGEETAVLAALRSLPEARRPFVLLAPRHPERGEEVLSACRDEGLVAERRTLLADRRPADLHLLVLDTVGELASLYGIADVAFVGGSLVPTGGHNPIEPARFSVPVLSGPHVHNFRAIYAQFEAAGAVRMVRDADALAAGLDEWLTDRAAARRAGQAGRTLVAANAGAVDRTLDLLEPLLR